MSTEHTPPPIAAGIGLPYLERKQKPDGTWREYECRLLYRTATLVVVRFVMERGGAIFGTPIEVPPGSVSHGYFWKRRNYNLYRMRRIDGSVIAHRFDAVADVTIGDSEVSYRDLIVDWWAQTDGTIIEEDRDELDELKAAGKLSRRDEAAIARAAREVWSRYRHIIDDVAAFEKRTFGD